MIRFEAVIKNSGGDKDPTAHFQFDSAAMDNWINKTLATCGKDARCEVYEHTRKLLRTILPVEAK